MNNLKYSKDGRVSFNNETHTYLLGDKWLQGVTGLISKYKNKFDADAVATKYALKHGLDKSVLLAEWKLKGEKSCEHGTAVHKVFENYIINKEIVITGNYEKEQQAVRFINEMFATKRLIPVDAEIIVYNESIASQIDCIAKNRKGEHYILDWKTNEKIETCGYNKFMLPPFNLYPDACFFHYSLQLSFYKELCNDYDIKGIYIIHIDNDGYNIIKAENIIIPQKILNNEPYN